MADVRGQVALLWNAMDCHYSSMLKTVCWLSVLVPLLYLYHTSSNSQSKTVFFLMHSEIGISWYLDYLLGGKVRFVYKKQLFKVIV